LNSIVNFTDSSNATDELTITQSVNPQSANDPNDTHTIDLTYTYGFE